MSLPFKIIAFLALTPLAPLAAAPSSPSAISRHTVEDSIPMDAIKEADINIRLPYGALSIDSQSQDLLSGRFYSGEGKEPDIHYSREGDKGTLSLGQVLSGRKDKTTAWSLRLNDGLPLGLQIETSGGSQELNLANLDISKLALTSLGGASHVDLSGKHAHLKQVLIKKASGRTVIDLSGGYPLLDKVDIQLSSSSFNGLITGIFSQCDDLSFKALNSQGTLDLRGTWETDLSITLDISSSTLLLLLPPGVGVQVLPTTLETTVIGPGFSKKGGSVIPFSKKLPQYTNKEFGKTPVTLTIHLSGSGSTITLK